MRLARTMAVNATIPAAMPYNVRTVHAGHRCGWRAGLVPRREVGIPLTGAMAADATIPAAMSYNVRTVRAGRRPGWRAGLVLRRKVGVRCRGPCGKAGSPPRVAAAWIGGRGAPRAAMSYNVRRGTWRPSDMPAREPRPPRKRGTDRATTIRVHLCSSAVPIPWLLNLRAAMPCNVRIGAWWRFGALARGPLLAPIGTPGLFGALQGSVVDRLACDSACVQERTGRQTSPLRRYLMQPENGELHAWARMPPPSPSPLRVSTWVRSSRPKPASAGEVRTPVFLAPRSRATQMHPTPPPPATQDLT
jgi:hypothetical protein